MVSIYKWIPKRSKMKTKGQKAVKGLAKAGLQGGLLIGSGLAISSILESPEISQDQTGVINIHSQCINIMEFAFLLGMAALCLGVAVLIFIKVRIMILSICKRKKSTKQYKKMTSHWTWIYI